LRITCKEEKQSKEAPDKDTEKERPTIGGVRRMFGLLQLITAFVVCRQGAGLSLSEALFQLLSFPPRPSLSLS